jgi:glycosyltransferase involved in cell wall biosynthesis
VISVPGGPIGAQRNAGIEAARNEWILALDADERAGHALAREIGSAVHAPEHEGYRLRFRSSFLGRELRHGAYANDWHIRLFTRRRRYSLDMVHERLEPIAAVGSLSEPVDHVPFRDFPHYLEKVLRYARWGADDLARQGRRVAIADLLFRPAWRFVRDYVLYAGFRDGVPGFLVSAFAGVGTLLKYSYRIAGPTDTGACGKGRCG